MFAKLTRAEYDAIDALNASGAKLLLPPHGSPAKFFRSLTVPRADKPAFAFGRYFHALELEPEEVALRFSTGPDLSQVRTKDGKPAANPAATVEGKALVAEWYALNPGVTVLDAEQTALGVQMLGALRANAAWQALHDDFLAEVRNEWSLSWTDAATGVACKGQADRIVLGDTPTIIDLKTDGGADFGGGDVQWEAIRWGWHRQSAWYVDGLAANGYPGAKFVWAVVEKEPPHDVAIYTASPELLEAGRAEMRLACEVYAGCRESGIWPSAQDAGMVPRVLGVPRGYKGPQLGGW
jgi:hypothetical protein